MLTSQSPNTFNKSKPFKKSFYNKKKLKSHPYLECVQMEISTLEEDLRQLEELEKEGELTSEQTLDKQIKQACLERYQATLDKLMESSMSSKVRSFQDMESRNKDEQQTLFLLQFFYLVRLGQLGLFNYIDTASAATLKAITDVCDQLVGAAVYVATDPKLKAQKRSHLFSTLKKLEVGSDDEICDKVTFKDLKELMQHIWDHTATTTKEGEEVVVEEEGKYVALAFDNMVGADPTSTKQGETVTQEEDVNQIVPEKPADESQQDTKPEPQEEKHAEQTGWDGKEPGRDEAQDDEQSGWKKVQKNKKSDAAASSWATAQNGKTAWTSNDKPAWTTVQNDKKSNETSWTTSQKSNETSWTTTENDWNTVKSDSWESSNKKVNAWKKEDENIPPASTSLVEGEPEEDTELKSNTSESTENWRHRESSRGRGTRGRGRGNKIRGRGRGAPRGGRGRGKGRHEDSPPTQNE